MMMALKKRTSFALLVLFLSALSVSNPHGAIAGAEPLTAAAATATGQSTEAARRLYFDAEQAEQEGDLEAALEKYELVAQQFPDHDLADDALLRLARGRWLQGNVAAATEIIDRLKSNYQGSPGSAGAFVLEADMQVDRARGVHDLQDARETLELVPTLYGRSEYPTLEWRAQALMRTGEVSILLGEVEKAAAAFLSAIEDEPASDWTADAQLGLATVLLRSGDWVSATEILQRVVDEAEEAGTRPAVVAAARRRLSLAHRLVVRPSLGQRPWVGTRHLQVSGTQFKDPIGVAATENGWLTLIDEGIPLVIVVDPAGTPVQKLTAKEVRQPFFGPDGAACVTSKKSVMFPMSRLREDFSVPEGNEIKPLENLLSGTQGIFGDWLILDEDKNQVFRFSSNGSYRDSVVGGDRSKPVDLERDYLGRIYVLDREAERVVRLGPDGSGSVRVASGDWRRPEAIALDELGNLYILDRDEKMVMVFNPAGQQIWAIGPSLPGGIELRSPRDIAVDGQGRLYIADKDLPAVLVLE
jgi:TolA-binding protein